MNIFQKNVIKVITIPFFPIRYIFKKLYYFIDCRKYNLSIINKVLMPLTLISGAFGVFYNHWCLLVPLICTWLYMLLSNRASTIEHYIVTTDLNTNKYGDVIEFYVLAYDSKKQKYQAVTLSQRQLDVFLDIKLLNNCFSNLGYLIIDDMEHNIRILDGSKTEYLGDAMMNLKQVKGDLYTSLKYASTAMQNTYMPLPLKRNRKGIFNILPFMK